MVCHAGSPLVVLGGGSRRSTDVANTGFGAPVWGDATLGFRWVTL